MATSFTVADVRARGAEFSAVSDNVIQSYINDVTLEINFNWLGERAVAAGAFLTCHYMKLDGIGSTGAGPAAGVAGIAVGPRRVDFYQLSNSLSLMRANLSKTSYGVRYLNLIEQSGMRVI